MKKLFKVILVLCLTLYYFVTFVSGVGFRYRADPRSGQKRLWIHVPGSSPNVLTEFDDKPYFGPKNLIDVNRPGENYKQQQRRPFNRPNSYPSNNDDEGGYSSRPQSRPPPPSRQPDRPSRPPRPPPGRDKDEGYLYPPPNRPFNLPGSSGGGGPLRTTTSRPRVTTRRTPSRPQVGYPDVPIEENYGIGQNSEENKDLLAGRPFRPEQQEPGIPTRRPTTTRRPTPPPPPRPDPFRPKEPSDEDADRYRPQRPSDRPQRPPERPFSDPFRPSGRPTSGYPSEGEGGGDRPQRPRPSENPNRFPPQQPPRRPSSNEADRYQPQRPSERPQRPPPDRFQPERPFPPPRRPDVPPERFRPGSSSQGRPGYGSDDEGDRPPVRRPSGNEESFGQGIPPPPSRNPYGGGSGQGGFTNSGFESEQQGKVDSSRDRVSGSSTGSQSSGNNFFRPSQGVQENGPFGSNNRRPSRPPPNEEDQRFRPQTDREFSNSGAGNNRGQNFGGRPEGGNRDFQPSNRPNQQDRRQPSSASGGGSIAGFGFSQSSRGSSSSSSASASASASASEFSSSGFSGSSSGNNQGGSRNRGSSGGGGGGSYGGGGSDDESFSNTNSFRPNNQENIVAPNFGPIPPSSSSKDGTNNKDMSECGKDGKDEFYSNRLGRCVGRNAASKGY